MIEAMTIGNKQISNLSASGDATQISAILDVHQTVINIGLSPETNQDSELVAELLKFLNSLRPSKPMTHIESMPPPIEGSTSRHPRPTPNLSQDLFSVLRPFRGEYERAAANYKRTQGSAILSRYQRNRERVDNWLRLRDSMMLPMIASPEEATKLTLEVVHLIDGLLTSQSSANGHIIRLTHLCGENSDSKREEPNIMVLDLIAQVLVHQQKHGGRSCSASDLAAMEKASLQGLWDIFWDRVHQSGIKYLFIFLDNVDKLFLASKTPTQGVQEALRQLVRNLKPSDSRPGLLIKAMVTSKEQNMAQCFV